MKTLRFQGKRRYFVSDRYRKRTFSKVWMLLAAGYLIGCAAGAFVAISADSAWVTNLFSDSVDKTAPDLLTVFCGYAAYGFFMLLLATSYLGFFLIPIVLTAKGFLSGCMFTVGLTSGASGAFYRAAIALFSPGVFLLPGLMILGRLCIDWSVRMLHCRFGETLQPGMHQSGPLAMVLVFLLMAAAVKSYFVPFMLNLI